MAASAVRKTASGTRGRSTSASRNINQFGVEANADKIGMVAAAAVGVGVAAHAAVTAISRVTVKHDDKAPPKGLSALSPNAKNPN